MSEIYASFGRALVMIAAWDADLAEIVGLSLRVSLGAVALAAAVGLPLGAAPCSRRGKDVFINDKKCCWIGLL